MKLIIFTLLLFVTAGATSAQIAESFSTFEHNSFDQAQVVDPIVIQPPIVIEDSDTPLTIIFSLGIPILLGLIGWYFKSWITFQFQKRLVRYQKKIETGNHNEDI